MKLDDTSLRILEILERDAKLSIKEISRLVKIPATTVHSRIKKLEEEGIIKKYTVEIDQDRLGKGITAYILINVNQPSDRKVSQQEICRKIKAKKEAELASIITGTKDIIIRVRVESIGKLNQLITHYIRNIDGIDRTETMIVLEDV